MKPLLKKPYAWLVSALVLFAGNAAALPSETCELCTIREYCILFVCWDNEECIRIDPEICRGM